MSSRLIADVRRDGRHWRQSFTLGTPDAPVEELEETELTGTTITFFPSAGIFETTNFNYETLATRFREMAFLNRGLRIEIADLRTDRVDDAGSQIGNAFHYEDGLIDFVRYLNGNRETFTSVIDVEAHSADLGMGVELAMQWNTSYGSSLHTFANTINTHEGGTHEEGFRAALTTTVNKWGEAWGLIRKREDRVGNEDIREGLTAILSVKIANPQFEGQTKTKLGNTEARSFVQKVVNDRLGDWMERNPANEEIGRASCRERV